MSKISLTVVNAETATFDCSFGRGCEGLCCKNGRPSVTAAEVSTIKQNIAMFLPHMRPEAVKMVKKVGWLGARKKVGLPMLRVSGGWCIFFNAGCVLHKVGAAEGDFSKYKPIQCSLFPLEPNGDGTWYVRQWNYNGEGWDIFCLNPKNTPLKAVETLAPEIAVAEELGPKFDWGKAPQRKNIVKKPATTPRKKPTPT